MNTFRHLHGCKCKTVLEVTLRQHTSSDDKVDSVAGKLSQLNQGVKVEAIEETITGGNISQVVAGFAIIDYNRYDSMDNLPALAVKRSPHCEYRGHSAMPQYLDKDSYHVLKQLKLNKEEN